MQDAPTTQRDQHQHTSSNNAFIAPNATSNHFLGRQQKSWALPRQSSFGSDQYQSPETVDSQAQQLNRGVGEAVEGRSSQDGGLEALRAIQAALASRKNGPVRRDTASGQAPSTLRLDSAGQTTRDVVRSVDDGRPRSSYIDSGPAGIDSAPVGISGQLQAAMASPSQPSKRPRLDAQVQQGSFQALETQTASSHNFVASPTSPISILAYSHLAPSSISSPQVDSGAGGYRQGHMPDSPQRPPAPTQLPTPTIPQRPLSARVPTQTTPRRESSSMPSPSVVTPTNVGQAAISAEAQLHPNARPRRTPSVPNVPLQSGPQSSMGRLSTLAQLPRLDSVMSDPRTRDSFKDWAQQRVSLLKEACNSEDWFYLTLHQIYCWRSLNGAAMAPLDITGTRDSALAALEVILIPNIKLQHKALQWFSQFPVDPRDLFRASGPQSFNILQQLHTFLDRMATEWPEMHASCLTRNYPPSPNELYARLAMPSTVLQVTFFTYVFRQIEGIISSSWVSQAIQFFKFTQSQLIDKMKRVSLGLPEEPPKLEYGLAQYASEYFALRHKHTSGPMRSTSDDRSALNMADTLSIPAPGPSPQSTPAVSDSTSQDTNRVSRAPQNVARPGAANLPAPGIFSGLNTGGQNGGLRRSAPQPPPVPPNNPQNTQRIGPRQQEFVQDITGATIQPSTTVVTANGLSPAVSHPSGHPPLVNSFSEPGSWPQTAPGVQNRAAAGQSPLSRASQTRTVRPATTNGGPRMQQHNTVPQVKTSLLPPTGRLMTRNIHPNSDVLALHQARLLSPEPRIITTADEPQPIGRLFQVMQRFILSPQLITMEQSYYEWQIGIPAADMSRKANDVPILATRPSSKLYREFKRGSIIYRLRCVAMPDLTQSAPSESQWSTAATNWPNYCFVSLADSEIPIRRKSHFGRDLPCDLMPGIRTGLNTIEMSVHYGPEELSHVFAVAVEQIGTFSAEQCTQQITLISQDVALAAIVASLQQPQTENDDDITIVDSHLSIDLIDPFTAQVCRIPVRGRSCTHRECFDLQAFLESRPNKVKGVPLSSSDEWRCPICSRDARPQSLLLDGFLHAVVRKVREDARGQAEDADEVRAILVTADGQWWPKKAERHQQPRRDSKSADGTGMGNGGINVPYAEDCKDAVMRDATTDRPVVMELD